MSPTCRPSPIGRADADAVAARATPREMTHTHKKHHRSRLCIRDVHERRRRRSNANLHARDNHRIRRPSRKHPKVRGMSTARTGRRKLSTFFCVRATTPTTTTTTTVTTTTRGTARHRRRTRSRDARLERVRSRAHGYVRIRSRARTGVKKCASIHRIDWWAR